MSKLVRVRLESGAKATIPASHAESAGLTPLDKPALAGDGSALPTKPRVAKGAAQPTTPTPEARPASDRPKEG